MLLAPEAVSHIVSTSTPHQKVQHTAVANRVVGANQPNPLPSPFQQRHNTIPVRAKLANYPHRFQNGYISLLSSFSHSRVPTRTRPYSCQTLDFALTPTLTPARIRTPTFIPKPTVRANSLTLALNTGSHTRSDTSYSCSRVHSRSFAIVRTSVLGVLHLSTHIGFDAGLQLLLVGPCKQSRTHIEHGFIRSTAQRWAA